MKLTKDWYAAAARKIHTGLTKVKNEIENQAKKNQENSFWESEEGVVIKDLQNLYNSPCKTQVLTFNLGSHLPFIPQCSLPVTTNIIDRMILAGDGETEKVLEIVFEYYINKMKIFYSKHSIYETVTFESILQETILD